ncbi:MAG: N-acetylmuramoyl-L-alanine amidase [Solirubrobacterales bacterium]
MVVAIVVAGVGYVAGPALSTRPYMPGGVDFEQPLPQFARLTATHGTRPVYRTGTIDAPARFDLAGIAGESRPVQMRARLGDGDWTRWTESEDQNPIYFGGADQLQVRARGWRPSGTLHYVNVSGTTTGTDSLLTAARRAINSGFISVAGVIEPAAEAAPTRPPIITRAEWGADLKQGGCHPRAAPAYGTVKAAVVHHTVTAVDYTEAEAPEIVLGICRYHRNANGWNDIGYQALIDRFGNIYAGRAGGVRKPVVGAQAQGFNAQTTAVASIGTHTTLPLEPTAYNAFVDYLAWRLAAAGLQAFGHTTLISAGGELSRYPKGRRVRAQLIFGHRTVGLTACPGDALNAELSALRRDVQAKIVANGGPEPPPPSGGVGRP